MYLSMVCPTYGDSSYACMYVGRGAKSTGRHTNKGGYMIRNYRIPEIVVPNLDGFKVRLSMVISQ